MRFQADECSIYRMLMGYLKDKCLFETLNSLQLETGLAEEELGSDMSYLQRLVLQGRWDDVLLFMKPFHKQLGGRHEELEYIVHHQQLLEALSWQGGGGHRHALLPWKPTGDASRETEGELEVEAVVRLLKSLEGACPSQEFNSLCLCLTLERLSDNPDFAHWSVSQGRLESFQKIKNIVKPQEIGNTTRDLTSNHPTEKSGLLLMLAMGLAYQVQSQNTFNGYENIGVGGISLETAFDGSILVAEGVNVAGLSRDKQQLPYIAVRDSITNQLYDQSSCVIEKAVNAEHDLRIDAMRGDGPMLVGSNGADCALRIPATSTDISRAGSAEVSSSSSATRERERQGLQSTVASLCAVRQPSRAAPVAWIVETEPAADKERDSARVGEVRSTKRKSFAQSQMSGTAVSVAENRRDRNAAAAIPVPIQSSYGTSKNSECDTRNMGSSVETPSYRGDDLQGTVVLQADCPLRCVRVLTGAGDSSKNDRETSPSWMFAVGSNDKSVKVARVSDFGPPQSPSVEVVREFSEAHRGSVYAMDWGSAEDGLEGLLATASNDKAVRVLNVISGSMGAPMKGHTGTIRCVAFQSRGGRRVSPILASAGAGDNRARLWDVSTGSSHSVLPAHSDTVHGLAWLQEQGESDGLVLSGCERGTIIAHDVRARSPAWTLDLSLSPELVKGGGSGVCCFSSVCASRDASNSSSHDSLVVAGCIGGYVCVINATRRTIAAVHRPHTDDVRSVSVFHDGRRGDSFGLITTSFDGLGALWNVNSNPFSFELGSMMRGHTDKILGVSSSVSRGVLEVVTTGADGKAILWTPKPPNSLSAR